MTTLARPLICAMVLLGLSACAVAAATPPTTASRPAPKPGKAPPVVIIDPAAAGIDFMIQGEYAAQDGPVALQLISRRDKAGATTFHGVVYTGGLPGAGWDGKKKVELDGKLDADKAELANNRGVTIVADGQTARVKLASDAAAVVLPKIERHSPTLGAKPPEGATVLFDGTNTDAVQRQNR